jgi:4,5-dihydroxyphthalate decarboxylase
MAQELIAGNIPAAIGVAVKDDRVSPLIANPLEAGLQCLQQDGHYPINHLVVVRNDILAQHPELAPALFHAFAESKQQYVADLKAGKVEPLTAIDRMHLRVMETMADPLPYGIEANRKTLETLIAHATAQGILQKSVRVEDVFAHNTLHLSA